MAENSPSDLSLVIRYDERSKPRGGAKETMLTSSFRPFFGTYDRFNLVDPAALAGLGSQRVATSIAQELL
jgi:hypothetical protein